MQEENAKKKYLRSNCIIYAALSTRLGILSKYYVSVFAMCTDILGDKLQNN